MINKKNTKLAPGIGTVDMAVDKLPSPLVAQNTRQTSGKEI